MIEVRGLTKEYSGRGRGPGGVLALDDINLEIRDHEFITIIGPSGCGKTTLLKIIAGLARFDSGEVLVNGNAVTGPGPERAVVFQSFALMPWADVLHNVTFGLELRGVPKARRTEIAMKLLKTVGLDTFAHRLPKELSGGMQQRVGIARALAVDPEILLMDEPFGALDEQSRRFLQEELLRIWEGNHKTVVFVTHSMEEAVLLADRIVLMTPRPGKVKEIIPVDLPRPRARDIEKTPEFNELKEYVWESLRAMYEENSAAAPAARLRA